MDNIEILAVDDELGMLTGISRTLEKHRIELPNFNLDCGFSITKASTGKEATAYFSKNKYDIYLLDYKLPDTTGLELLGVIKELQPEAICIMITAYASIDVAVSATKNGAFDFLAKPFAPNELRAVIQKAAKTLILEREARKLAADKKKVRFQFISVLAHELKAPLNAVDGNLKIMDSRISGENIASYDRLIKRGMIRLDGMRKLILDLLDLTRIESGEKKRALTNINIIENAKKSIELHDELALERNIKITLEAPETAQIFADNGEIDIIFNNLISNAIKYNVDNGKVTISLSKIENYLEIKVSDTGFGMTKEEINTLFGEFVRIKNKFTKNILGSGLGLSILKKITNLYKGEVTVTSQVGSGTTFTCKLYDQES